MKKTLLALIAMIAMSTSLTSCNGTTSTTVTYYEPQWYYNCYPVYDYWGYYLYDECFWEYYNQDGTTSQELDLVAEVADKEALIISKTADIYAEKFALSNENATKIAKNVYDFSALKERTNEDVMDFAQKLYGVNPSEVISAVAGAQVGENADLDTIINKAAANFGTDSENMKAIVKELHGRALSESGIEL